MDVLHPTKNRTTMEYAISLEKAREKDGRSENIYVDNPLRTCRSTPCQTLLPDTTAWNKTTVQRHDSALLSGRGRRSPVGPSDAVRLPLPHRPVSKSNSFGRVSPVVQAKGGYPSSSSCSSSMQLVCGQKYSPGGANPDDDVRLRPGRSCTPNAYFRSADQCQTSSSSSSTTPREREVPQTAASDGGGDGGGVANVTGKTVLRGPPQVCPRCGRPRDDRGGEDPDEDGGGGTVVAAAYDQDRVVDAVSCLCCVKAIFYHCCSDEDDDARCSDSPCSCAAGRPMCCPRWACLVVAGATCLPCLILYWPVRILVRLFAGCRRRRRRRHRAALVGSPDRCCCDDTAADAAAAAAAVSPEEKF